MPKLKLFLFLLSLLLLGACGDSVWEGGGGAGVVGGGAAARGGASSGGGTTYAPAPQMESRVRPGTEQHGAVNSSDCKTMEQRFLREGRRVRLTEVRRNDIGTGGVLNWICIFEGEDVEQGYYTNYNDRYNTPDEYKP